ncbi:MAG TPA: phosphoribosylamine--glycine ligase [Spirochaetota bacterium]|nr:phosphoribosylamine--glycine ligase [Spirochaetota bacterium]
MNIVVIGSGGREHALCWKLKQSPLADEIFALPGNGGIPNSVDIDPFDFQAVEDFCKENDISLIVVGPENPLAAGITDYFTKKDIMIFGPDKAGAALEGSKIFAKEFMLKYGVATAGYHKITSSDQAEEVIDKYNGSCVLKYDGLAAGKGVYVCCSKEESSQAVDELLATYGNDANYIIEELLVGDEISIIGITDGKSIKLLSPSQDHKQLCENDEGPNTGGMGAFTPVPFANDKLLESIDNDIVKPTLHGIIKEGYNFKGIVYFGIMVTKNGPKLLEYNVRFGDPETEVLLPALKSDLLEIFLSCFDNTLDQKKVEFNEGYFVDVVLAAGGYPREYNKGDTISGLDQVSEDTLVFHAGTIKKDGNIITNGGRVLNVVCGGKSLDDAISKVYSECSKISFDNCYIRKDIGRREQIVK